MPAAYSPVPHFRQSNPGACLPAAARMVLAALGDDRTEAELAGILGSYDFGTPASHIKRLSKVGYRVDYHACSLAELRQHLSAGMLPIVFVSADWLPWADFSGFHALVLAAIQDPEVWLHDPALTSGPTALSIDGFLAAWSEFDYLAAVVSKSNR